MDENKKYITGKGVDAIVDVEHKYITEISIFEEQYEKLSDKLFTSVTSEKRRVWTKKFKINIFKLQEDAKKDFEKLILSFYHPINSNVTIDEIKKEKYIPSEKTENINLVEYIEENNSFIFKNIFLFKDTIYTDIFRMIPRKKGGFVLNVQKHIKVPFPLELLSQNTHMAKWQLKGDWKEYKFFIKKGLIS